MDSLLEVIGLTASYAPSAPPTVHDVSFSVRPGELVAILGPNGSGKSTLLRSMTGGMRHVQGKVLVEGEDCLHLSARRRGRRMALLPQHVPALPGLLGREVLEMGRYPWDGPLRPPGPETRQRILAAAAALGVEELLERPCDALSQGQQQLLHLARVTVQDAPVLLLDEPNSALDFLNTHQLFRCLDGLLSGGGRCAVAVLHDPALALRWCSRLLLLHQGRLVGEVRPGQCSAGEVEAALARLYPGIRVRGEQGQPPFFCTID